MTEENWSNAKTQKKSLSSSNQVRAGFWLFVDEGLTMIGAPSTVPSADISWSQS